MAAVGDVVFQRNQDDDEDDIWDDTALIKAYDSAIKSMKTKIDGVNGGEAVVSEGQEEGRRKHHKKKWKSRKAAQKQSRQWWNVDDRCTAAYSEDGQMYEAVILSINRPAQTCLVRYLGYGNEELQTLSDIFPPVADHDVNGLSNDSHAASDDNTMDMSPRHIPSPHPAQSPHPSQSPHRAQSPRASPSPCPSRCRGSQRGSPRPRRPGGYSRHSPFNAWPNSPGMPQFPFMPPTMPPPFSMPSWPGRSPTARMPQMPPQMPPPPPPPVVDEDVVESDSEALYSMLIAWYMSGYHTGYYQGLKQGKLSKG